MKRLAAILKASALYFFMITTFLLIFMTFSARLTNPDAVMYQRELYRVVVVAFFGTVPSIAFAYFNTWAWAVGWFRIILVQLLHIASTAIAVFGILLHYGWLDLGNALRVFGTFLVIYAISATLSQIRENRIAKQMNERLSALHGDNE